MPKKINAEIEILALLKSSKYGFSISKLAQKLGYSRTTVSKYLNIMEKKKTSICSKYWTVSIMASF